MFSQADRLRIKAAFDLTLNILSTSATWTQAKAPQQTQGLTLGFSYAGKEDPEVVASLGYGAVILMMKSSDLPIAPEKFDRFDINGTVYIADTVKAIPINDGQYYYQVLCKGK